MPADRPCRDGCNNPLCDPVRCFGILPTVVICGGERMTTEDHLKLADWLKKELAK
jgi:hypothetical protein